MHTHTHTHTYARAHAQILLRDLPGYVVQDHRDATLEDPSVGSAELKLTMANLGEEASGSSKDDSPTEPKGGPREVVK